jgi:predicted DNA-binding transcriptional regulator YafY
MATGPIPEDIRRFVLSSIPSVPHLEALLLLRSGEGGWSASELAERLYVSDKAAAILLAELCRSGMCLVGEADSDSGVLPRYHYQPATAHLGDTIDQLAALYAKELLAITHLIHSRLDRKAQQFADAFKWRKDD